MSHLSLETIARLVEDEPDTTEAAHLSSCAECRTRLDAMTEDVHALAMLPDMAAVPDGWNALERRLTDEGLIRHRPHRFGAAAGLMQAAAALLLFFGGAMAGRMSAPADSVTASARSGDLDRPENVLAPIRPRGALATETGPATDATDRGGQEPQEAAPRQSPQLAQSQEPPRTVTLAANAGVDVSQASSPEEAAQFLRAAESAYLEALTGYAERAPQSESGDLVARLAALQSIIMTTTAALDETPADPVINGYHLTALAQRDATLRQVALASSQQWY
jgi:hypothetical protein